MRVHYGIVAGEDRLGLQNVARIESGGGASEFLCIMSVDAEGNVEIAPHTPHATPFFSSATHHFASLDPNRHGSLFRLTCFRFFSVISILRPIVRSIRLHRLGLPDGTLPPIYNTLLQLVYNAARW